MDGQSGCYSWIGVGGWMDRVGASGGWMDGQDVSRGQVNNQGEC